MELEDVQEIEAPEDDFADEEPAERPYYRTVEEAAEALRDIRNPPEPEPEPEKPKPKVEESSDPGAVWTTEDVQTLHTLKTEADAFQKDLAEFQRIKNGVDLNELERTDRAKAQMFRVMLREAEADLRQRQEAIGNAARIFQGKAHEHGYKQSLKKAQGEKAKLLEKRPDFDMQRVVAYVKENGGTEQELASISDHRHFVALWDACKANSPARVPKFRKRPTAAEMPADLAEAEARFRRTGRTDDAARVRALRKHHRIAPPEGQPKIKDLRKNLKRTGRIDDAVALLKAKRTAA